MRPRPGRPEGTPLRPPSSDRAIWPLPLVGVCVASGVWLTGQMSALLWAGRWPTVALGDIPLIVVHLAAHPSDPRRAWPSPARTALPPAGAMAVVAVLIGAAAAGLGLLVWRSWVSLRGRFLGGSALAPRARGATRRRPTGARWANRRDLRSLRVGGPVAGRLVIGRSGRTLLATEARHSLLVVGPTQSGKTSGLAIPAILEWRGPVVATSVKGDLAATTSAWRGQHGRCWIFDPTQTSGAGRAATWSPLLEASDWSGAQRMAAWLVDSTPARVGLSDSAFWYAAAAKLLAPLLLAASRNGMSMADVVGWNDRGEFDEPTLILDNAGELEATVALYACAERDDRIRSSVATTLETVLAPFEDPVVASSTASSEIDPVDLINNGGTLYLCGPSYEQARLQGLFAALVSSVVAAAVEEANRRGGALDPPLLLVLDEAANIAPIRDLDTLAATGAGLGIQLITICQDLAQFTTRYSEQRARTIANNHRAKLILSGVSDLNTLDLISGLAGDTPVREETITADLRDGRRTRSSSISYRRLAPPDELRRTPPGEGILVYGHLPAARVHLRPWFAQRHLLQRASGG